MKEDTKIKNKYSIDKFIGKSDYIPLVEPSASHFKRNKNREEEHKKKVAEMRGKLEEIYAPIELAHLEQLGFSIEQMNKILEDESSVLKKFEEMPGFDVPNIVGINTIKRDIYPLCREVSIIECQHKVCVNQVVPVSVEQGEIDVDATTYDWLRNHDQFGIRDVVKGEEWWNIQGHHQRMNSNSGIINFKSYFTLLEQSKVRDIGVNCSEVPSTSHTYYNGYMACGDNIYIDRRHPDWGHVLLWTSMQVRSKHPSASEGTYHIPESNVDEAYLDKYSESGGRNYHRPAPIGIIPPNRSIDLNQTFPADTEILIDFSLRYLLEASGNEGYASISHRLQINPFLNLESCSWEW